jgi:hypothetical protein
MVELRRLMVLGGYSFRAKIASRGNLEVESGLDCESLVYAFDQNDFRDCTNKLSPSLNSGL